MSIRTNADLDTIRTIDRPVCVICSASKGKLRYAGLRDRLFQTPGFWNLVECSDPECGTLWLDPAPLPKDLPRLYQNYYTHETEHPAHDSVRNNWVAQIYRRAVAAYLHKKYQYGSKPVGIFSSWLPFLLHLFPGRMESIDYNVFYQPAIAGGHLFEIGCGNGVALRNLKRLGWAVEGVDFDPHAVAMACKYGLKVQCGDPLKLSTPGGFYDVVAMGHVIEHVPEPRQLLAECLRLLKPGGILVVVTPNARGLGHCLMGRNWLPLDPPRHLQLFISPTLSRICEDAGFRIVASHTTMRDAAGIFTAWLNLRFRDHYSMEQQPSLSRKVVSHAWQALASGIVRTFPHVGDELVCIAQKPSANDAVSGKIS